MQDDADAGEGVDLLLKKEPRHIAGKSTAREKPKKKRNTIRIPKIASFRLKTFPWILLCYKLMAASSAVLIRAPVKLPVKETVSSQPFQLPGAYLKSVYLPVRGKSSLPAGECQPLAIGRPGGIKIPIWVIIGKVSSLAAVRLHQPYIGNSTEAAVIDPGNLTAVRRPDWLAVSPFGSQGSAGISPYISQVEVPANQPTAHINHFAAIRGDISSTIATRLIFVKQNLWFPFV